MSICTGAKHTNIIGSLTVTCILLIYGHFSICHGDFPFHNTYLFKLHINLHKFVCFKIFAWPYLVWQHLCYTCIYMPNELSPWGPMFCTNQAKMFVHSLHFSTCMINFKVLYSLGDMLGVNCKIFKTKRRKNAMLMLGNYSWWAGIRFLLITTLMNRNLKYKAP